MEPEVRYCTTSDDVRIAYDVTGRGPPTVWVSPIWGSHLSVTWRDPRTRQFLETLAADFTLVRYDGRGSGLSQREPFDFSLEARLRDLEAVIDRTQTGSFALLGNLQGCQAAITYATRHPDRVSALILNNAYASGPRFFQESPAARFFVALQEVTEEQWDSVTLAISNRMGPPDPEAAERFAELLRASMTPAGLLKLRDATRNIDLTPLLKDVSAPTLVVHQEGPLIPLILSQELASGIPNARIVSIEAPAGPFPDNTVVLRAIKAFLGVSSQDSSLEAQTPAALAPSDLRTIFFTDVEGSTALTQRLGDAAARDILREHERITREALKAHGGSEVKTLGDGFMASFGSATKALECAVAIQKAFAEPTTPLPAHPEALVGRPEALVGRAEHGAPIRVRIGLNAGEPVAEDGPDGRADLFGTAVNLAARIAAQARGGEILASDVVRQLVAGKGFLFNNRGEHALKGFEDPVRVWEVRWSD